jgi:hypothetical protein
MNQEFDDDVGVFDRRVSKHQGCSNRFPQQKAIHNLCRDLRRCAQSRIRSVLIGQSVDDSTVDA